MLVSLAQKRAVIVPDGDRSVCILDDKGAIVEAGYIAGADHVVHPCQDTLRPMWGRVPPPSDAVAFVGITRPSGAAVVVRDMVALVANVTYLDTPPETRCSDAGVYVDAACEELREMTVDAMLERLRAAGTRHRLFGDAVVDPWELVTLEFF